MPDEIEVETKDLQESIQDVDERAERKHAEKEVDWIRFIGLSTAILAVFAAIAALQSSNLVNEALIHQIKASDTWAEYQADRQKDHVYTIALNGLLDAAPAVRATKAAAARIAEYRVKVAGESRKETALSDSAKDLERETEDEMRKHHAFEYSVALLQVAIAVGAVSALTRVKPIWYLSLLIGAIGSAFCVVGFIH
ncbi:MAG: DUF4337 domain-containing protein [Candidatus Cybelea sp.]